MAMEANSNKVLYKVQLYLLKVIPMVMAFIYLINTILSYFDIDLEFLSYLGSGSMLMIGYLYVSSYVFKFCEYHRMFLHYIVVINVLNTYDYYIGIPINDLMLLILYQIISGIFLFIIIYLYVKTNKGAVVKGNR